MKIINFIFTLICLMHYGTSHCMQNSNPNFQSMCGRMFIDKTNKKEPKFYPTEPQSIKESEPFTVPVCTNISVKIEGKKKRIFFTEDNAQFVIEYPNAKHYSPIFTQTIRPKRLEVQRKMAISYLLNQKDLNLA